MKLTKRLFAAAIATVMVLGFAGCHKKNEIAVTVGDVEFTSAYYMAAFLDADYAAKVEISENLTEEEQQDANLDFYSKKIDGKKYANWVKDTAIENLKKIAAYKILCKENGVELKDDVVANAEANATFYYQYGYTPNGAQVNFADNGVSEATYTKYFTDSNYNSAYFDFLYAKDGKEEIAAKDVKTKIYDSFVIADVLDATFEENATDEDKEALEKKLKGYLKNLKNGKKTFEEVYNAYNNITEEEEHDHGDEAHPKDELASVIGGEDTSYNKEYYETVKKMKKGEAKLIELEDGTGFALVVKQDIKADKYYLDELDSEARHLIKDEDYEKLIDDYVKTLKADVSKYAIGQFKVKKIAAVETAQ